MANLTKLDELSQVQWKPELEACKDPLQILEQQRNPIICWDTKHDNFPVIQDPQHFDQEKKTHEQPKYRNSQIAKPRRIRRGTHVVFFFSDKQQDVIILYPKEKGFRNVKTIDTKIQSLRYLEMVKLIAITNL